MPFHRFESIESKALTPDLSSGRGPVIEGRYMYFCLVHKMAGTGSELHYHPNELLIFPVRGKLNGIVGKDRRIAPPGTFVHAPAYARHSMRATEDGDCSYLYIKDKTWTVVGLAADQAVPDQAMTVDEINRLHKAGKIERARAGEGKSQIIVDGLHECFYPLLPALDAPQVSGRRVSWIEGERLGFGLFDVPGGYDEPELVSEREVFVYMIRGTVDAAVGGEKKMVSREDVIHIPKGARYRLKVRASFARYAMVCSTPYLERRIDGMTPDQAEQARINLKAI
jgi:quercetin dioxygenase-like cupin family protein